MNYLHAKLVYSGEHALEEVIFHSCNDVVRSGKETGTDCRRIKTLYESLIKYQINVNDQSMPIYVNVKFQDLNNLIHTRAR